jgi:hypothetical protein
MKRSRQVEEIFEECLELVFKGESIEECLRRYPEHESELRDLLETSVLARKALAVQPSPEFRERARQQLYAAQREKAAASAANRRLGWTWQPRWATAVAAVVLVIVAGSSTVLASVSSMPGQALYGVKHAAESARVALTPSKTAKAEVYASLADQRVKEIIYAADRGDSGQVQQVTNDLNSYLNHIAALNGVQNASVSPNYGALGSAAAPTVTVPPMATAAPTTGPATDNSGKTWTAQAPPPVTITQAVPPRAAAPPTQVTVIVPGPEEKGLTAAIPTVVVSNLPTAKAILKARISFQAADNSARLRAAYEKAPPQAKLALLKAIAVSQSGYEKALQSLDGQP